MRTRDIQVVDLDRDLGQDRFHETLAPGPPASVGQLHTNQQLGGRDRCDHDVILVAYDAAKSSRASFRGDKDGGV